MALQDNLVAYYKLDGNSNDSVGSNNGTDTSITYGSSYGKIGQGAGFNGSNSGVDLGNFTGVNSSSAMTVSAWVKKTSNINYGMIIAKGDVSAAGGVFELRNTGTTGKYEINIRTTVVKDCLATSVIPTGVWTHILAVYNGSDLRIYINGVLENTTASVTGNLNSATTTTYLGRRTDGYYFGGALDEVGIWSRALSSTEVGELYNSGAGLTYPFTKTATGNFFQLFN